MKMRSRQFIGLAIASLLFYLMVIVYVSRGLTADEQAFIGKWRCPHPSLPEHVFVYEFKSNRAYRGSCVREGFTVTAETGRWRVAHGQLNFEDVQPARPPMDRLRNSIENVASGHKQSPLNRQFTATSIGTTSIQLRLAHDPSFMMDLVRDVDDGH